uniref:DUF4806 domain-containing protein n=1 Tax=Mesocestoides corti TaxID=53468 RepID=A0A5K3G0M5_MESCO
MSVGARDLSSGELSSCSSDDEERGAETYSFQVTEADEAAEDGVKLGSRKRPLKERLPSCSFDRSVSREHYGVDFDSPPAKVVTAITNFLDEQREDLVGRLTEISIDSMWKCGSLLISFGRGRFTHSIHMFYVGSND